MDRKGELVRRPLGTVFVLVGMKPSICGSPTYDLTRWSAKIRQAGFVIVYTRDDRSDRETNEGHLRASIDCLGDNEWTRA